MTASGDATGVADAELPPRGLRVEAFASSSQEGESAASDDMAIGSLDDDLGSSEDFWDSWESEYAVDEDLNAHSDQSSHALSASGSGAMVPGFNDLLRTVGDVPVVAKELLQKVESEALPFDINHPESMLLAMAAAGAGVCVLVLAVVLVGLRRRQLSEPGFGPIELVSDLPDAQTTTASGVDAREAATASYADEEEKEEGEQEAVAGEEGVFANA
ncbi:hypothetical protein BBJ28_00023189 [Nothophytophthora sp. Chile5]|nr:hypothetical protein BBJ28_00023189 [Nothophytophthora sp. Chile5]